MDREQALLAFEAYMLDEDDDKSILLPHELLSEIAAGDVPADVVVEVGVQREGAIHEFWNGRMARNADGSFCVTIAHDIVHKYWREAVGSTFYLDLLHKCVISMLDRVDGLMVRNFDDSDDVVAHLEYNFQLDGENLADIFDKANRIQADIESPAQQVLNDVTRALASSVDRVLRGHYAQASDLISRVDAAELPADKGASLEALMATLFEQVPGFVVYQRNVRTETEEIDLVVLNNSQDPIYLREGPLVLVECKNWTTKPGRPEFSLLEGKIRNRYSRSTIAFLVSWSGFADTTWRETIRLSREKHVIVCLTGSDVRRAALEGAFPEFLRQATLSTLNM